MKNPFSDQNTSNYLIKQQVCRIHARQINQQSPFYYKSNKSKYQRSDPYFLNLSANKQNLHAKGIKVTNYQKQNKKTINSKHNLRNASQQSQQKNKQSFSIEKDRFMKSNIIGNSTNQAYNYDSYLRIPHTFYQNTEIIRQKDSNIGRKIINDRLKRQNIQYQSLKIYGFDIGFRQKNPFYSLQNSFSSTIQSNLKMQNDKNSNFETQNSYSSKVTALFGCTSDKKTGEISNTQIQSQNQRKCYNMLRNSPNKLILNNNSHQKQNYLSQDDVQHNYSSVRSSVRRRSSSKLVKQLIGMSSTNNLNADQYRSDFDIIDKNSSESETKIIKKKPLKGKDQQRKCSIFFKRENSIKSDDSQRYVKDQVMQLSDNQRLFQRKAQLNKINSSEKCVSNSQYFGKEDRIKIQKKNTYANNNLFKGFTEDDIFLGGK